MRCSTLVRMVAVVGASALLAGCAPTTPMTPVTATVTVSPSTSSSPAASPSMTATSAPSTSSAASSSPPAAAVAGRCADAALAVTVQADPTASGAGQRGSFVVFRNTGSASCVLQGTPGLSLVGGGNGTQIGQPAQRDTDVDPRVRIAVGGSALSRITFSAVDAGGGAFGVARCEPKAADGYRVHPPHSYRAYFSRQPTYACSTDVHWISVGPVEPGEEFEYFTPKS